MTAYEMRISDWSSDVCSSDLHRAFVREAGLVGQADAHRVARTRALALAGELGVAQVGLLVAFEVHVHRVLRDQRGQQRLVGLEIGRASCRERVCQYV